LRFLYKRKYQIKLKEEEEKKKPQKKTTKKNQIKPT